SASLYTDAFPSYCSGYMGEPQDDRWLVWERRRARPNCRRESFQRQAPIAACASDSRFAHATVPVLARCVLKHANGVNTEQWRNSLFFPLGQNSRPTESLLPAVL